MHTTNAVSDVPCQIKIWIAMTKIAQETLYLKETKTMTILLSTQLTENAFHTNNHFQKYKNNY